MVITLMVWLPSLPASSAGAKPENFDRYLQKLGGIKIPRIPPPMDFVLSDLEGHKVRLSNFKGQVVLLNFWTTWCPECRVEMPDLEKLHQHFKDRSFVLLAVDLREPLNKVKRFFDNHKLSFTALLDSDGRVSHSFGIRSIPTTFIIDQSGGMVGKVIGSRKWNSPDAIAFFEQLISSRSNGVISEKAAQ